MTNYDFLKARPEYTLFAAAAIEAERVYATSPAMCAVGSRKALELAVKWVYAADSSMQMPYIPFYGTTFSLQSKWIQPHLLSSEMEIFVSVMLRTKA